MIQRVPETSKLGKEKCYLKVWIKQAIGLKASYNNGTFILWSVISVFLR